MMVVRNKFFLSLAVICLLVVLGACSSKSILSPDCYTCVEEPQAWKEIPWGQLVGNWKGKVEAVESDRTKIKKDRTVNDVNLRFLSFKEFKEGKQAKKCEGIPGESVVLNGQLWLGDSSKGDQFEVFSPDGAGGIQYGRIELFEEECRYHLFGRVMNKNRLDLPISKFTRSHKELLGSRNLASLSPEEKGEETVSLEFLRFNPQLNTFGRGLASADLNRAPLMIRVFQITTKKNANSNKSEWVSSTERIYRLDFSRN